MPAISSPGRDMEHSLSRAVPSQNAAPATRSRGQEKECESDPTHRIRIGFVVHVMQVAGAEMLVAEIVRRMRGLYRSTIFCLDGIGPLGEQLRAEGIEVVNLERRPGKDYRTAWRMARSIQKRGIELVHAHQYTPFFYAALAKVALGGRFRLILTEHGRHFPDIVSPRRRLANRWLLGPMADADHRRMRFQYADSLARHDGFSRKKMAVIDNGIVLDRYNPVANRVEVRAGLGLEPAKRYIGNIARFHPVKDQAMLLKAFAHIAAVREDTDLLLVGDGPLRETLIDLSHAAWA